jgi:hypothetical protein
MSRTTIAALAAAATIVALSLSACAPGHPGGGGSPRPHPGASHASSPATPSASATAAPVARLSTTPGDELLTFSGTGHSTDGSVVAMTFTVHAPVAWNSAAGSSTLAALAAAHTAMAGTAGDDLRVGSWDDAHGASLAVVDYSATMVSGSWRSGEQVEMDLGPDTSEVAVNPTALAVVNSWWTLTGPGSGHFVVAYPNINGSTPDPSNWADALQIYGLGATQENATSASYQFHDCRIDITPLGRRSPGVAGWFSPTADYCFAGIGE